MTLSSVPRAAGGDAAEGSARPDLQLAFAWRAVAGILDLHPQRRTMLATLVRTADFDARERLLIGRIAAVFAAAPSGWRERLASFGEVPPAGESGVEHVAAMVREAIVFARAFPWLAPLAASCGALARTAPTRLLAIQAAALLPLVDEDAAPA